MEHLSELAELIARWVHLIAGIMWIGNSMLFNWLDRNLVLPPNPKEGLVGEIWMVHSGGFYQVEKKFLAPSQMPKTLHWFKWQNGITWLSGISLLILVFYMRAASFMVDPQVALISPRTAVAIGVAVLVVAYVLYDLVWRSPLGKRPVLGFVLSVLVVAAGSAVLFSFLSGRAAYIHVGVMLGTLMTGNVWFVILPSQRELIAATNQGRPQDPAISYQAKQRSIHNNYMTFPLLFIMLSGHFPSTYRHAESWLVLLVLVVGSAAIRHFMNIRYAQRRWLLPATLTFFAGCTATWFLFAHPTGLKTAAAANGAVPTVGFVEAHAIIQKRCTTCHSAKPTTPGIATPPKGVVFDTAEQIRAQAAQIKRLACELRDMPLANMTQMTDDERDRLRAWIDQGAKID
jgi:uncharacterized membrane protein